MTRVAIPCVLLALALAGCGAPDAAPTEPTPVAGEAATASLARPDWKLGDAWVYATPEGARITRQLVREGVPCAAGACWEMLVRVEADGTSVDDLVYYEAALQHELRFPMRSGDEWQDGELACKALDARALGEHTAVPVRCEGAQGSLIRFYSQGVRNLVQVNAIEEGASGEGAPVLTLVEHDNRALAQPSGVLGVPSWRVGQTWTFAGPEGVGTLRREVAALEVACGALRCYHVTSTFGSGDDAETTSDLLEMATLARVIGGASVGDVRFPLRVGDGWAYEEPAGGLPYECSVLEGFLVACIAPDGGRTAAKWTKEGLASFEQDGERWSVA